MLLPARGGGGGPWHISYGVYVGNEGGGEEADDDKMEASEVGKRCNSPANSQHSLDTTHTTTGTHSELSPQRAGPPLPSACVACPGLRFPAFPHFLSFLASTAPGVKSALSTCHGRVQQQQQHHGRRPPACPRTPQRLLLPCLLDPARGRRRCQGCPPTVAPHPHSSRPHF